MINDDDGCEAKWSRSAIHADPYVALTLDSILIAYHSKAVLLKY